MLPNITSLIMGSTIGKLKQETFRPLINVVWTKTTIRTPIRVDNEVSSNSCNNLCSFLQER